MAPKLIEIESFKDDLLNAIREKLEDKYSDDHVKGDWHDVDRLTKQAYDNILDNAADEAIETLNLEDLEE
jgi:hypothetical protein